MMRVSIARLRVWLLVGAGLLVAVITAFLGYAHLRAHRFLKDLPGRLGADITRESNGFTYSQSLKGKTVYTIHAAKMVQRKDGKTTLHDVGIVLYGQRQDRADRIYGSEFEYDQKAGVVRAMGEVHLDLQAPAPADARGRAEYAAGRDSSGESGGSGAGQARGGGPAHVTDARMVHVTTSDLVFVQSLGAASTDQEIEFEYNGLHGRAKGANYNSGTGVTVLQSEVRVSGLRDGQPMVLTASHAEMERGKGELTLQQARYVAVGEGAAASERGRTLTAGVAAAHLREDGSITRVVAGGGVSLEQAGGVLRGRDADVSMSVESRPEVARISGGVTFTEDDPLRQVQGRAGQGVARFNQAGRVESAVMTEAAEVHAKERATADGVWNERTITGGQIDMSFGTSEGKRPWLREGRAEGGARMVLVDRGGGGGRPTEATTELRGDTLTAEMVLDGRAARLSHVGGVGHTSLRRHDLLGAEDTSSGETLEVSFGPGSSGAATPADRGGIGSSGVVTRAVQRGGVALTHVAGRRAGEPAAPSPIRASAAEADFEGSGRTLTLRGQAEVSEGDSLLRAETVTMQQDSGDGTATGAVRVSYRQAGSAEPVHVLSQRAEFRHEGGRATFYGGGAGAARLWQGASQVEAPVIEFSRTERTLLASGGAEGGARVRTVLVSGNGKGTGRERPQVMRVSSGSLRYSDAERKAQFGGGAVLVDADGMVRGTEVVALLKPGQSAGTSGSGQDGAAPAAAGLLGGGVDRITVEGGVEVTEPGRRATGERLVYTAADGMFVMTGTAAVPPRVVDEAQGSTTGGALQFHAGDNSVMVLGNGKGDSGQRVRTETQVRRRP